MNQAILYSKENCLECERAKALLYHLDVSHLEYKLGKDFNDKQFYAEFGDNASYPQITIDYNHIGTMKDLLRFLKQKEVI